MTKFRSYALIASFIILSVVSIQGPLLEAVEHDLGTHMIIEHALFFLLGALSVTVAEILLKALVLSSKENNVNDTSDDETDSGKSNGQYTRLVIIVYCSTLHRLMSLLILHSTFHLS